MELQEPERKKSLSQKIIGKTHKNSALFRGK